MWHYNYKLRRQNSNLPLHFHRNSRVLFRCSLATFWYLHNEIPKQLHFVCTIPPEKVLTIVYHSHYPVPSIWLSQSSRWCSISLSLEESPFPIGKPLLVRKRSSSRCNKTQKFFFNLTRFAFPFFLLLFVGYQHQQR